MIAKARASMVRAPVLASRFAVAAISVSAWADKPVRPEIRSTSDAVSTPQGDIDLCRAATRRASQNVAAAQTALDGARNELEQRIARLSLRQRRDELRAATGSRACVRKAYRERYREPCRVCLPEACKLTPLAKECQ